MAGYERNIGLAALGAITLAGCATVPSGAGADVRALALALQSRDTAGIEARIDRPALRAQVAGLAQDMLADSLARSSGDSQAARLAGFAVNVLAGSAIEQMADVVIQPPVLAALARDAGLNADTRIPGQAATALALRRVDPGRVCAPDRRSGACLLYFSQTAEGWKLSGIGEQAIRSRLETQRRPANP